MDRFDDRRPPHSSDQDDGSVLSEMKKVASPLLKRIKLYGTVGVGLILANSAWFTVSPNDRANIRRLGEPVYSEALKGGLHFKVPMIDTVDRVQTALTTQEIKEIDVGTVDNQRVKLKINFNYEIDDTEVNRVLYKIGGVGNKDIADQVERTVESVAVDTISTRNMNDVNLHLEEIRAKMELDTFTQLKNLYGIKGRRLQIESVTPSPEFMASNANAVNEKNKAVAAENTLKTKEFEARQKVITAQGDSDSQRVRAEGAKSAAILEGEGNRARFQAEVSAFGSPDKYIEYQKAQAMLKWNGQQPQIVTGNGTGTNLVLPLTLNGGPK